MAVTVLVVDDQQRFRLLARAVVAALDGFEVVCDADSAEVAVRMADRLHPDLILMDLHMPGTDGLEATRRILAGAATARPAVVLVLSVDEGDDLARDALEAGAFAFIPKSELSPERLRAAWHAAQSEPKERARP